MPLIRYIATHVFLVLLVFFFLYPVAFNFLPLSTRICIAAVGGFLYLGSMAKGYFVSGRFSFSKRSTHAAFAIALFAFVNVVSAMLNLTFDFEFVRLAFSLLWIYFAYIAVSFFFRLEFGEVSFVIIAKYILYAILLQMCITLMVFLSPSFASFINGIQRIDEVQLQRITGFLAYRMIGLGSSFFGAGTVNGFGLMLIAVLLRTGKHSAWAIAGYGIAFLFIFLVGITMARTTYLGCILAFIYLFFPVKRMERTTFRNFMNFMLALVCIPVLVYILVTWFFPAVAVQFQAAFRFGFELFFNYSETGKATSVSSENLKELYIYPEHLKTYLIGDGRFYNISNDPSSGYYMVTDVGFLRLIFFMGIPGLLAFYFFEFRSIQLTLQKFSPSIRLFGFMMFIYVVLLNFKGFADVFSLIILFNIANHKREEEVATASFAV